MHSMKHERITGSLTMESFILKLAVAVIPLVILIASTLIISDLFSWNNHHPLSWHRKRRQTLRAMAAGIMLR